MSHILHPESSSMLIQDISENYQKINKTKQCCKCIIDISSFTWISLKWSLIAISDDLAGHPCNNTDKVSYSNHKKEENHIVMKKCSRFFIKKHEYRWD